MEIKIPKEKIFNYDFDVLRNNYINRVNINEQDAYNFIPLRFSIGYSGSGGDIISNGATFEIIHGNEMKSITYGNNMYFINYGYIQLPNNQDYNYDTISQALEKINVITYTSKNKYSVSFSSSNDYRNQAISISDNDLGGQIIFDSKAKSDGKWHFKVAFLYRYNNSTIINNEFSINFHPTFVDNTYIYKLDENSNDSFSLSTNTFFDKLNKLSSGNKDPIFIDIAKNIIKNYNNGLMGLELETRVSKFYDDSGVLVNGGKPYLIKVGDVVLPEFPERFKMYEKKFEVTSSEYIYDGTDKVILKLSEYFERELGNWYEFYSSAKAIIGESFSGFQVWKKVTNETQKIRISGQLQWTSSSPIIELSAEAKVEGLNKLTKIYVDGSNYIEFSISDSNIGNIYVFFSNQPAIITNFKIEEYY